MDDTIFRRNSLPPISNIELPLPSDTDFSLANIPFAVFSPPSNTNHLFRSHKRQKHICTAIGDYILDLYVLTLNNVFTTIIPGPIIASGSHPLLQPTLNSFAALGNRASCAVRSWIRKLIEAGGLPSGTEPDAPRMWPPNSLWKMNTLGIEMHLPFNIGSATYFCASREYAIRHRELFRGEDTKLHSNYLRLPIGYQEQPSSVVITGTPINRPYGQIPRGSRLAPRFGPTEKMDYEVHLAAFIGVPSKMGHPVHVDQAMDHIFGFVLLNDWSARDLEGWECEPLGPFTRKNFGTTISPWVVTLDAIHPFLTPRESQFRDSLPGDLATDSTLVTLLSYLNERRKRTIYDFRIECHVNPPRDEKGNVDWSQPAVVTTPKHLIWSFPQMVAQKTRAGNKGKATLLERNGGARGKKVDVGWSKSRRWLEDKDEVVIRAWRSLSARSKTKVGGRKGKGVQTGTKFGTDEMSEAKSGGPLENTFRTDTMGISSRDGASGKLAQTRDEDNGGLQNQLAVVDAHIIPGMREILKGTSEVASRVKGPQTESVSPLSDERWNLDEKNSPKMDGQETISISNSVLEGLQHRRNKSITCGMSELRQLVNTFPFREGLVTTAALIAGVQLPEVAGLLPRSYYLTRGLVSASSPRKVPERDRLLVYHEKGTMRDEPVFLREQVVDERVGFGICSGVVWPAVYWKQTLARENSDVGSNDKSAENELCGLLGGRGRGEPGHDDHI